MSLHKRNPSESDIGKFFHQANQNHTGSLWYPLNLTKKNLVFIWAKIRLLQNQSLSAQIHNMMALGKLL